MTPYRLWRWESDRAKPDIDAVRRLAEHLGVSLDVLLGAEQSVSEERLEAEPADAPSSERVCPERPGREDATAKAAKRRA